MSDLLTKRQFSQDLGDDSTKSSSKRQETTKKVSKPGRKPIDSEPKNKRTAQNRAAQRAFRERKEQKMKDLEDKISLLEDEKKSAHTEADFLRVQVQMLMSELAKHRGTSDISDLKLPTKIPTTTRSDSYNRDTPSSSDVSSTFSPIGSESSNKSSTNIEQEFPGNKAPSFSFEFPWGGRNSFSQKSPNTLNSTLNSSKIPALASDSSTTSSTESSPFELYNTEENRDLPLFNQIKKKSLSNNGPDFQFNDHFDEGISEFCNELNSACGTRECPIPKSQSSTPSNSPIEQVKTPAGLTSNKLTAIKEDPLSFLSDSNLDSQFGTFDPTLAFVNDSDGFNNYNNLFDDNDRPESDPIASLTTEESLYDPFSVFNNFKNSPIVESNPQPQPQTEPSLSSYGNSPYNNNGSYRSTKTKSPLEELGLVDPQEGNEEVVPAREERLMKCSEIWDRVTAHPKYSEIDIDGLCSELRSKAKCSDKGVVIDFSDVNNVIMNSLPKKKN